MPTTTHSSPIHRGTPCAAAPVEAAPPEARRPPRLAASRRAGRLLALLVVAAAATAVAAVIWHPGWLPADIPAMKTHLATHARSWMAIGLAILLAASLSSMVGFAFSAIAAVPIFYLVPGNVEAVQIMLAASIGLQAYSVLALHGTISWRTCAPFLLGGAAALPLGLHLLLTASSRLYFIGLGAGLAVYGAYMLAWRPMAIPRGGLLADVAAGALGGLTGPLAAIPGVPVTIWCSLRGCDKTVQRSIYQPYILIMQILTLVALGASRGKAAFSLELAAYALPGAIGAHLGLRIFRSLSDMQFHKLVSIALIISGIALALKS